MLYNYYVMKKTVLSLLLIIALTFVGCKQSKTPVTKTGVYFDTVISITLYENNSSKLIDDCFEIADRYEQLFSKTITESDVSKVNSSYNQWINVNEETYDLISRSFEYEELSGGRFSVMCGALTSLWDVSGKSDILVPSTDFNGNKSTNPSTVLSEQSIVPTESEITTVKRLCGMHTLDMDESTHSVRVNTIGAKLDLGAVAKGYIADKMKEYLISKGVTSGIIQLGGNVLLIGENPTKPDGFYNIGISTPFYGTNLQRSDNEVITAVSEKDTSIVTSGNYQRYFEYNDRIYHHIIDLTTGYPADTGLNSVTIITDNSCDADALSTVCFLLGKEKGANLLDSLNSSNVNIISAVFVDSKNQVVNY